MGCDRTEAALSMRAAFKEATNGLDIPHEIWSTHVAEGSARPTVEELEEACDHFEYCLYPDSVHTGEEMEKLREQLKEDPESFRAKHLWVMKNVKMILDDAERKHAATPGEAEYAVTILSENGDKRTEAVHARSRAEAEEKAKRLHPDASEIKSETDSLGRPWAPRRNYSGYTVSNPQDVLDKLKRQDIEPKHERLFLEHVTYQFPDKETAPGVRDVQIVGYATADGVEAVVVSVDGTTERPDGSVYHITMSLAEGHKPFESNKAIQENGYISLEYPISLKVDPF